MSNKSDNNEIRNQLLAGVHFYDSAVKERIAWDSDRGILVDTIASGALLRIVGHASPFLPGGNLVRPVPRDIRMVHPIASFDQLPKPQQTTGHGSRGHAFPRMYTDPGSAWVGSDVRALPDHGVGLWAVTMERRNFRDGKPDAGGKLAQILHHVIQVADGVVHGPATVVEKAHQGYKQRYGDDVAAVRLNLPPSGQLALSRAGVVQPPAGVEAGFVLPIDPELEIEKLGEFAVVGAADPERPWLPTIAV